MHFSDLHIHSKFSDGTLTPDEIVEIAKYKGVKCISITDHDTIDSQMYLSKLKSQEELLIIPGIELSTEYKDREIHILGYFVDIHNNKLVNELSNIKNIRIQRARDIIEKLKELDIDIEFEELKDNGCSIGRPHIAKILVEKGISSNIKDAFHKFLMKGKPAYVNRYKISYREALRLINEANGIAVLAHPGEIYRGFSTEELIKELRVYGLKGIEVFHPSHSQKQTNDYFNLAKKYSLLITGGSDCHGIKFNNDFLIGSVGLDENLTTKFLKAKY